MIGRSNGNPVVAGGDQKFIENVFDMGEGQTGILVRERRPIGPGTKFDKGSQMQVSLASMVGDSLRRAQEQKQLDPLMAKWKNPMHQLGFDYNPDLGKLTFDVGNEFTQGMSLEERVAQHTSLLQN